MPIVHVRCIVHVPHIFCTSGALQLFSVGVGFKKIFDSKFENFTVFQIFLHSKIVSNLNRIFLDVRRVTHLSSHLTGTVYIYVQDYSTYKIFDSI